MKAKEIMVSEVPSISRKASVKEAVLMLKSNFGDESFLNAAPGLVVVNESGELAGMLTPLTLITALLESSEKAKHTTVAPAKFFDVLCRNIEDKLVEEIMERQPISVTEDALILDVAELFVKHRFQRVPVVRNNKVVGIVYRTPLLFYMTKCFLR
ncbi:MAG TPA: CBS domain-containing protein [Geobacteraceae bacterium]|nr:CBS domain-containing protein [Geobacteraceae bacterium]